MPNSAAMALQLQNILNEKRKQCRELTKELQEEGKDVSLEELTLSSLRPSFVLSFVFDPANSINIDVDNILQPHSCFAFSPSFTVPLISVCR